MEFSVLLDAPGEPAKRIQIAKLGDFHDPRYGDFSITQENVANWQRNLSKLPGGEALIDFEHRSERKPRDSSAAGWITGIELDGEKVMAAARWTPKGEQAIKDEIYRFMSPVFGPALGADNERLDDALPSAALTNKPVLGLPALTLASEERLSAALEEDPALRFYTRALDGELGETAEAMILLDVTQAERDKAKANNNSLPDGSYPINNVKQLKAAAVLAASKHGNWQAAKRLIRRRAKELGVDVTTLQGFGSDAADSRRAMDQALLTTLGLQEDEELVTALSELELDEAAEKKLLDAATALKDKAEKPTEGDGEPKTLEQQASEQGMVILDAEQVKTLQQQAASGAAASAELHEQKFESAFTKALSERKVAEAERESLHRFFTLDAEAALKALDAREPIMLAQPAGKPAIEFDPDQPSDPEAALRAGVHPGSHEVYRKVQAKLKSLDKPQSEFPVVLEQMMRDGEL